MDVCIPPDWQGLNGGERDVLVALALDGPGNGTDIHRRLNGDGEMSSRPNTYRHLNSLVAEGYVSCESVDERENKYRLTEDGMYLLGRSMRRVANEFEIPDSAPKA